MLQVDDYGAIRRAHRDGMGIRQIARQLGHSKRTVRKVLVTPEPLPYQMQQPRRAPKLGALHGVIAAILKDEEHAPAKQRHAAQQIFRRLVAVLCTKGEGGEPASQEETDKAGTRGKGSGSSATIHVLATQLLSDAERRVFDLLLHGEPEKIIARRLSLSSHTVHNHVRAIFKAFGVHSRAALLATFVSKNGEYGTSRQTQRRLQTPVDQANGRGRQ